MLFASKQILIIYIVWEVQIDPTQNIEPIPHQITYNHIIEQTKFLINGFHVDHTSIICTQNFMFDVNLSTDKMYMFAYTNSTSHGNKFKFLEITGKL